MGKMTVGVVAREAESAAQGLADNYLDELARGGLDVVRVADHLIDLGPEGGDEGGHLVAEGTPVQVAAVPESYTGQALRNVLPSLDSKAPGKGRRRRAAARVDR